MSQYWARCKLRLLPPLFTSERLLDALFQISSESVHKWWRYLLLWNSRWRRRPLCMRAGVSGIASSHSIIVFCTGVLNFINFCQALTEFRFFKISNMTAAAIWLRLPFWIRYIQRPLHMLPGRTSTWMLVQIFHANWAFHSGAMHLTDVSL
jgi:hypothetical protein